MTGVQTCALPILGLALVRPGLPRRGGAGLGGGGARGSGRVSFSNLRLVWRGKNYYASGAPEKEIGSGPTLAVIQAAVADSAFSFLREE